MHIVISPFLSVELTPYDLNSEKGEESSERKASSLSPNPELFLMTTASSFKRISPAGRD
jgi:hypothetical protein